MVPLKWDQEAEKAFGKLGKRTEYTPAQVKRAKKRARRARRTELKRAEKEIKRAFPGTTEL